jgi:hypothetical protein
MPPPLGLHLAVRLPNHQLSTINYFIKDQPSVYTACGDGRGLDERKMKFIEQKQSEERLKQYTRVTAQTD